MKSIRSMGLRAVLLLGACSVCGAVLAADNASVVARDAWVRMPAASRTDTAAYMVIENKGAIARAVVSASSPDVAKIEMHEMKMSHGGKTDAKGDMSHAGGAMMTMAPVARINVPVKGTATLAPNGAHLMLFGVKSKLAEGGKLTITLKLDDGSTVPVSASVRRSQ
jgi:periplasmic copper chaperone A